MDVSIKNKILELYGQGKKYSDISREVGLSHNRVYRIIRRDNNKDKIRKYNLNYRQINKEKLKEYDRSEKHLNNCRNYQKNNKELRKKQCHKYYQNNKDRIKNSILKWRLNNREKRNNYCRLYNINKRKIDLNYRLSVYLRTRLWSAIKLQSDKKLFKNGKIDNLIGCPIEHLKQYIESKFLPGMNWDNHSQQGWHIDHKIPCANFNLTIEEERKKCFHYTNLQPLWAKDNWSKGGKII